MPLPCSRDLSPHLRGCIIFVLYVWMPCLRVGRGAWKPEEGVGSPGAGVTVGCELPREPCQGPLKNQPGLSTVG